jgi:Cu2+-exporting ATPase
METIEDNKPRVVQDQARSKATFPVTGMSCAGCAISVESMLGSLPGVDTATVNFATQSVQVAYNPSKVTSLDMQKAIQSVGYDLIVDQKEGTDKQQQLQHQQYEALKTNTIWALY